MFRLPGLASALSRSVLVVSLAECGAFTAGFGTLYSRAERFEEARMALSTAIELYRAMEMTCWLPQTEAARAQTGGKT